MHVLYQADFRYGNTLVYVDDGGERKLFLIRNGNSVEPRQTKREGERAKLAGSLLTEEGKLSESKTYEYDAHDGTPRDGAPTLLDDAIDGGFVNIGRSCAYVTRSAPRQNRYAQTPGSMNLQALSNEFDDVPEALPNVHNIGRQNIITALTSIAFPKYPESIESVKDVFSLKKEALALSPMCAVSVGGDLSYLDFFYKTLTVGRVTEDGTIILKRASKVVQDSIEDELAQYNMDFKIEIGD